MKATLTFLAVPAALMLSHPGQAAIYLTVEQAQQVIFPNSALTSLPLTLTDEQIRLIEKKSNAKFPMSPVRAWQAPDGGTFLVDEVLGKHEFITYAVGISPDGAVRGVEILEYRESYGHEIRDPAWRAQFAGKMAAAPPQLGRDIENISGATLSSKHVTDGVRRLLVTWDLVLRQQAPR